MKFNTYAIAAQYSVPPMPNRQQRRAAERKVRKRPNGSVITMPIPITIGPTSG